MSVKKEPKDILLAIGINKALIANLSKQELVMLVSILMDHPKEKLEAVKKLLISLLSLELRGKKGAIYLAYHHLATVMQLKNLTPPEIDLVVGDHQVHQDDSIARKNIKKLIILNQQEELFVKSGGLKGEYYMDPKSRQIN